MLNLSLYNRNENYTNYTITCKYIYIYTYSTIVCIYNFTHTHKCTHYVCSIISWYLEQIGSSPAVDTKICHCLSPIVSPQYPQIPHSLFQPTTNQKNSIGSEIGWISACKTWGYGKTTVYVYWKNLHISGPIQLKPMLLKHQLYMHVCIYTIYACIYSICTYSICLYLLKNGNIKYKIFKWLPKGDEHEQG